MSSRLSHSPPRLGVNPQSAPGTWPDVRIWRSDRGRYVPNVRLYTAPWEVVRQPPSCGVCRAYHVDLRPVLAEMLVQVSGQQSCHPGRLTVMITGHVPAVRLPPDHARRGMAAAVMGWGGVAVHRDLDLAQSARCAPAAVPPETEL